MPAVQQQLKGQYQRKEENCRLTLAGFATLRRLGARVSDFLSLCRVKAPKSRSDG